MGNSKSANVPFYCDPSAFCILFIAMLGIIAQPAILWSKDDIKDSGPVLTASLDRDSARVGSIVTLTLKYRLPEGAGLSADHGIKGLEDLTIVGLDTAPERIQIKLLIDRLETWESGPLALAYLDKEGMEQIIETDPVSLKVLSNLGEKPEEAELRAIQGIIPTKARWLKYLPWGAALLGILLVVVGVLWWQKRRRAQKASSEMEEPPHIRARKEIEQLERDRLFEKGQFKGFYFRFSEIIRRYLESLRGFPAARFTTEEIALCLLKEQDRKILPLLRQADLIKFADTIPTPIRKDEDVEAALLYIQETSPALETDNSPGDSGEVAG